MKTVFFSILFLFFVGFAHAFKPIEALNQFLDRQDSANWSRWDTTYVTPYKTHWRVGIGGFLYNNSSIVGGYTTEGDVDGDVEGHFDSESSMKMEFSLAYRSLGLSYTWDLDRTEENFMFNYDGDVIGCDFFINRSSSLHGDLGLDLDISYEGKHYDVDTTLSIGKKSSRKLNVLGNVYYVFNNQKFSYAAALSQKNLQKKSAGSFLLGATYARTRITVDDDVLKVFWFGLNQVDVAEVTLGLGYAHNFAYQIGKNHHVLYMFSFMPSIAIFNKLRAYFSASDVKDIHESNWIWQVRDTEELQFIYSFKNSVTYSYKNFFVGMNLSYMIQEMSNDEITLENTIFISKIFAGVRF